MFTATFLTPTNDVLKEISNISKEHAEAIIQHTLIHARQVDEIGDDYVMFDPVIINGVKRYSYLHIWHEGDLCES